MRAPTSELFASTRRSSSQSRSSSRPTNSSGNCARSLIDDHLTTAGARLDRDEARRRRAWSRRSAATSSRDGVRRSLRVPAAASAGASPRTRRRTSARRCSRAPHFGQLMVAGAGSARGTVDSICESASDERLGELVGVAEAMRGLLRERHEAHVGEERRDHALGRDGARIRRRLGDVHEHDLRRALGLERQAAREQLIEDDADGVEVGARDRADRRGPARGSCTRAFRRRCRGS